MCLRGDSLDLVVQNVLGDHWSGLTELDILVGEDLGREKLLLLAESMHADSVNVFALHGNMLRLEFDLVDLVPDRLVQLLACAVSVLAGIGLHSPHDGVEVWEVFSSPLSMIS